MVMAKCCQSENFPGYRFNFSERNLRLCHHRTFYLSYRSKQQRFVSISDGLEREMFVLLCDVDNDIVAVIVCSK